MNSARAAALASRLPRRLAHLRGKLYALAAPSNVGPGCRIGARAVLDGLDRIFLREKVILGDNVTLTARGSGKVVIGAKSFANAGCHVSSSSDGITLGEDVLLGPNVVIVDQDHAFASPGRPIARQGMAGGGAVVIGSGSWIAAGAVVRGPTRLAAGSVIGANAVVKGEFPRRCLIVGAPGRISRYLDDGPDTQTGGRS